MQKPFDLCAYLGRDKKHLFQKVLPIEKADTSKLQWPMWASEKFDGVFCCAIVDDEGKVHICSRSGEEYLSMEHLKPFLKVHPYWFNYLDVATILILFEAYIPGQKQNVVSGACRDTKNQHTEIVAMVHTFVLDGRAALTKNVDAEETSVYRNVEHKLVYSLEEAKKLADDIIDRGGEGLILHAEDVQPYQPGKRNASILKIKRGISVDLECLGVYLGKGKYSASVGGLLCRYKDGRIIRVSGMTDIQRQVWFDHHDYIVGKIVQIDAMGETANGMLREPRFIGIRTDKEEPDY